MKNLKRNLIFKVLFSMTIVSALLIFIFPSQISTSDIPIQELNMTTNAGQDPQVCMLGIPFGIKIYADGVMVVGMTDVDSEDGLINPASEAGIKIGDTIISINGIQVLSNGEVAKIIEESNGKSQLIAVKRNNEEMLYAVIPIKSKTEDKYKIGLWVRDSAAGIGTLTFYSPDNNVICGLGHGISDVDTNEIIPLNSGEFVNAEILEVHKGSYGIPGELRGHFTKGTIANDIVNDVTGLYGIAADDYSKSGLISIALKQEVVSGPAQILTTIDNTGPHYYNCRIEKIDYGDNSLTKNFTVKINDPILILKTGGIVQGMSGSPVIQNGKLVGAVTHVFLNDSTKGYGIFAENMYNTSQSLNQEQLDKAS